MTERKRARRTVRPGTRVIDGRGTGTVLNNTGLQGEIAKILLTSTSSVI